MEAQLAEKSAKLAYCILSECLSLWREKLLH